MDNCKNETIWTRNFTVLTLMNLVAYLGQTSLNSLLQLHMKNLGASGTLTGVVIGLASGLALLSRPVAGSIMDSARKKRLLLLCMVLYTIAIYGYAISDTVALTIVFRVVYGLGMIFFGALNMAMATEALPKSKIASGIGIFSLVAVIAGALGPMISLEIAEKHSVSMAFAVAGTLNTIGLFLCFALKYPKEERKKIRIDVSGAFAKEAVIPSILMFILQVSVAGVTSFLVLYTDSRSVTGMSWFYAVNCVFLVIVRPIVGKLADRHGVLKTLYPSIAIFIIALLIMPLVRSTPMLLASAVLHAVGYGTAYSSSQALCMKLTPPEKHGAGSNTFYLCFDAGLFFGPMLAGALKDAIGFEWMYIISAVPLVIALVMLLVWSRKHRDA